MRLNFIINTFGNNQVTNELTKAVSQLCDNENGKISPCIFTNNRTFTTIKPLAPVFNVCDLYAQPGVGIATDLSSALHMLDAVALDTRILYVQNLEWILTNADTFLNAAEIIRAMDIVICRSQSHADNIIDLFDVHPLIMESPNLNVLYDIVERFRNTVGREEVKLSERLKCQS